MARAQGTIQVDAMELILHGGAVTLQTHLERDRTSFAAQLPAPQIWKPEEEFALVNILGKLVEAMSKANPNKPEGVVLQAMANNYITPQTAAAFVSGEPIQPQKMADFQTQQFTDAWTTLAQTYRQDPPKRDAVGCVGAAALGRPLTGNEVTTVFNNLTEDMKLTPQEWQQMIQYLVNAVKLMKKDADGWNNRMSEQKKPTLLGLADVVREGVAVSAEGAFTSRSQAPAIQKPDEVMALLETYRDFWMALLAARQEQKLGDDVQKQLAQLLRHVGAKYVQTGMRTSDMKAAKQVDAKAVRFLIQKLRSNPMIKADKAKMAALEKISAAEAAKQPIPPKELVGVFDALGAGVKMTPDMLRAILELMIAEARTTPKQADLADIEKMMASGGVVNPMKAVRMINKATVQKPEEMMACLEMFTNFFLAMAATNQNTKLKDQAQRMAAETLQGASQLYGPAKQTQMATAAAPKQVQPINTKAYRTMLMKMKGDQRIKEDATRTRAVEELVAVQASGKQPSVPQLLGIFKDLGKGVQLSPEMLRIILEFMCKELKALSPNEKAEMQSRFKQSPAFGPSDIVDEATKIRVEAAEREQKAEMVGCFQVFPEGHPAFAKRPMPSRTKEVGMRAGPASINWHRYQVLGIQPPEEEMARVILVQSQLTSAANFDDEKTQKTLMQEAGDVSFKSILQPSVMSRFQESLKSDKKALSALQNLSRVGAADTEQLGKRVNELLTTLVVNRAQLRAVMQQLIRDKLMMDKEAKELERTCEAKMTEGGGKMKLSDLQSLLGAKKR